MNEYQSFSKLSDWNRCARKCPVQKPKPDLVEEGAELVFNSTNYVSFKQIMTNRFNQPVHDFF